MLSTRSAQELGLKLGQTLVTTSTHSRQCCLLRLWGSTVPATLRLPTGGG